MEKVQKFARTFISTLEHSKKQHIDIGNEIQSESRKLLGESESGLSTWRNLAGHVTDHAKASVANVAADERQMDRGLEDLLKLEEYQSEEALEKVKGDQDTFAANIDTMTNWRTKTSANTQQFCNDVKDLFADFNSQLNIEELENGEATAAESWHIQRQMAALGEGLTTWPFDATEVSCDAFEKCYMSSKWTSVDGCCTAALSGKKRQCRDCVASICAPLEAECTRQKESGTVDSKCQMCFDRHEVRAKSDKGTKDGGQWLFKTKTDRCGPYIECATHDNGEEFASAKDCCKQTLQGDNVRCGDCSVMLCADLKETCFRQRDEKATDATCRHCLAAAERRINKPLGSGKGAKARSRGKGGKGGKTKRRRGDL